MNISIKDGKKRHGNCVPFILINTKTKTVLYKGSLKELAKRLKITSSHASYLHRMNKKYKDVYKIKRVSFSETIQFN